MEEFQERRESPQVAFVPVMIKWPVEMSHVAAVIDGTKN
jgi:hypothetical protein